jgi:hypothetical protein
VAGVSYTLRGITIGCVAAMNGGSAAVLPGIDAGGEALRGYGAYRNEQVSVGVSYENIDTGGINTSFLYGSASLMLSKIRTQFVLSAGSVRTGPAKGFGSSFGAFFHMLKNAKIFGIFSYADVEDRASPHVFSLGVDYNYSLTVK